jgi:drug/metabolite transporter (DMT)-like permease
MTANTNKKASPLWVLIAFATVYIVWGSTYFFIQLAIQGLPPMLMGAFRFTTAGLLMLGFCVIKRDQVWLLRDVMNAAVSGLLLLFVGTGVVIWVERTLPSALVAIMVSASPVWVVLLDRAHWAVNFRSRSTITGLVIGFGGVLLLFGEQLMKVLHGSGVAASLFGMAMLLVGSMCWTAGSLYSKYRGSSSPARVNTAWQMIAAGLAFMPAAALHHEFNGFNWRLVPAQSWLAVWYLIIFGSIAAFSAYVWLLQVRPATQVSTHAYVNPVIAVILGVFFAGEHISIVQFAGLFTILGSVLLINMVKYQADKREERKGSQSIKITENNAPALNLTEQADS